MARKIFCLLTAFAVVFSFCACVGEGETDTTASEAGIQGVETTVPAESTSFYGVTTEVLTTASAEVTTTEIQTTEAVTEAVQTTQATSVDPGSWDTEKIVEFYKSAAEKTGTAVKSEQRVGLSDISVNNGQLGGVFSFVTPILSSFLSSSATVTDGITGEFGKLTVSDVSSGRAYETSKGTVVEITLNPQTDKADAHRTDGSVAHGISVVGDLLSIVGQLKEKGLPIDISVENTVVTYSEPMIKAVVDSDGKIVNGTWSCTVEVSLSDYKFAGSKVDSTVVVLDNKITVDGGFNP